MTMKRAQQGFSLVTAVFLVVVLAVLGAMMATLFSAQTQSAASDVLGLRAYQAARTGIEWGAANAPGWSGCPTIPAPLFAANTLNGELAPFTVTLTCSASSAVENTATVWVYNLTASASGVAGTVPGNADYAERVITASVLPQGASAVILWQ
jgi:MSHA biogenesis protein MshP